MKQQESQSRMFCPKCGSILFPKDGGRKIKLACPRCNFVSKDNEELKIQEKGEKIKKIEIMNEDITAYPKMKQDCPKCANKTAFFWTLQTRAGDEGETRFFECTKCKHRWREYS